METSQLDIDPCDCFIALMGVTGCGKSNFISACTGESSLETVESLYSCTQSVALHSMKYKGHVIHFVDVPGFSNSSLTDAEILQQITHWLLKADELNLALDGLIWLQNIDSPRFQGKDIRALNIFKALCGSSSYSHVTLTATRCDIVPPTTVEGRLKHLKDSQFMWRDILEAGGTAVRFQNTKRSALSIIDKVLSHKSTPALQIQQQLIGERMALIETTAGRAVYRHHLESLEHRDAQLEDKSTNGKARIDNRSSPILTSQTTLLEPLSMPTADLISDRNTQMRTEALRMPGAIEAAEQARDDLKEDLERISAHASSLRVQELLFDWKYPIDDEAAKKEVEVLGEQQRQIGDRMRELERYCTNLKRIQRTKYRRCYSDSVGVGKRHGAMYSRESKRSREQSNQNANVIGTWAGVAVTAVGVVVQLATSAAFCVVM